MDHSRKFTAFEKFNPQLKKTYAEMEESNALANAMQQQVQQQAVFQAAYNASIQAMYSPQMQAQQQQHQQQQQQQQQQMNAIYAAQVRQAQAQQAHAASIAAQYAPRMPQMQQMEVPAHMQHGIAMPAPMMAAGCSVATIEDEQQRRQVRDLGVDQPRTSLYGRRISPSKRRKTSDVQGQTFPGSCVWAR